MTSRTPFYLFISILIIAGLGLSIYRHEVYGVPWTQGEKHTAWELESRIEFDAIEQPVKVSMAAPQTQAGFTQTSETTSSPGYGVTTLETPTGPRIEWSIRQATGKQVLYYKTQMLVDDQAEQAQRVPTTFDTSITLTGPQQTAAIELLAQAHHQSADNQTLTL